MEVFIHLFSGMVKPPVPMTYQPVELEDAYFGGMPV